MGKCSAVVKQITASLAGLRLPSRNPLRIICATEQKHGELYRQGEGGGGSA